MRTQTTNTQTKNTRAKNTRTANTRTKSTPTKSTPTRNRRAANAQTMNLADKRRMARRLIGRTGRGFAEEAGFSVTNNPASLFQLLYLSVLAAGRGDPDAAARSARALRDRAWDTAGRLAASPEARRLATVRGADPRRDARRVAVDLGAMARTVAEEYQGDLRRLRTAARRNAARERQLLLALPGVSDAAVDLFFREVQVLWREIAPFADRRALVAARKLGLGSTTDDLSRVAGGSAGRESEKLAWLVGALVRVDLDRSYAQARRLVNT